eukprot:TRINITY_DN17811_c0_g2_i5.p1 TRINITY_DN17811_c0_g2~~TRINITY_DN17811_c0_g2_i5.p1  ORF type:complete len:239 (+),score=38.13 TRINITY_DN17811_c0_g2_i5:61-717(+)
MGACQFAGIELSAHQPALALPDDGIWGQTQRQLQDHEHKSNAATTVDIPCNGHVGSSYFLEDIDKPYLERFLYAPADSVHWQVKPGPKGSGPQLRALVRGHQEMEGHTFYNIQCSLVLCGSFVLEWEAPRRLLQLREGLHAPLKESLGAVTYKKCFRHAHFACRGGLPGTTSRLNAWFQALAELVNSGGCAPGDLAYILQFLRCRRRRRAWISCRWKH